MTEFTPINSLVGGVLIGLVSVFFLLALGRITGLSGMAQSSLHGDFGEGYWKLTFLLGLILAGVVVSFWVPVPSRAANLNPIQLGIAGLLVGLGTSIGSGCTSGHGVCGLGRRSLRSLVAVLVFMGVAISVVGLSRLI